MKTFNHLFLTFFVLLCSVAGHATDIVYKWKAGTVYHFQAVQYDDISMNISMGMNMAHKDTYKTELIFGLKINSVLPNGAADALLYVEQFKVSNKAGKLVASMAGIPKEALSSPVEVDRKGHFTYKKIVYMIVQDNVNLVVTGKAEENKVSASATSPDGTRLSVNAEFDPKTGTLKAGYSIANVGKPREKTVQVKEDAKQLDLLPYDFLELLSLPEGDFQAGQTVAVKSAGMDMTIKAESIINNIATMSCNFKHDMSQATSNTDTNIKIQNEEGQDMNMNQGMNGNMGMDMNGNMNMNMGGMNGNNNMGMSKEDQAMVPQSSGDGKISSTFDISRGMFRSLNGTINSSVKSMGMEMLTRSSLTLKALN